VVTRRLLLALIMYFAVDFAVPLEPGPGRFVIEDYEEGLAAPRGALGERQVTKAAGRATASPRIAARPRTVPNGGDTRPQWLTPPPLRVAARSDRPALPDSH
jgi:hypothetical protein